MMGYAVSELEPTASLVHSSYKKMTMFYAQAAWKDTRKHIYQLEHTSIFGIKSSLSRA